MEFPGIGDNGPSGYVRRHLEGVRSSEAPPTRPPQGRGGTVPCAVKPTEARPEEGTSPMLEDHRSLIPRVSEKSTS